jgi:uncharacterized protein (TIGR00375 family)
MIELNADFHIHGRYSAGTSPDMNLPLISSQASLKGLDIVATADALHSGWLKHLKEHLIEEDGLYKIGESDCRFIIQTEVEDQDRVHHLILLPSVSAAEKLHKRFRPYSKNIDSDGRPNISLGAEDIVGYADDVGAITGPSHAFTPWTSVYKSFKSIRECYGKNKDRIQFIELGLSADSEMADSVSELKEMTFMSNSDCHSPWPHRLGREFNKISVKKASFEEILKAIERKGGRGFSLNAGLNPLEGKYHVTACTRCYLKFSWLQAQKIKRRCPECAGIIKKGVEERIAELADQKTTHPLHRPPYIHILPLSEAISLAHGIKTVTSKKTKAKWDALVNVFGSEIKVLLDAEIEEIKTKDPESAKVIQLMRKNRLKYVAGGGGKYGYPTLKCEKDRIYSGDQKTLAEF